MGLLSGNTFFLMVSMTHMWYFTVKIIPKNGSNELTFDYNWNSIRRVRKIVKSLRSDKHG